MLKYLFLTLTLFSLFLSFTLYSQEVPSELTYASELASTIDTLSTNAASEASTTVNHPTATSTKILFVGDIMLGRDVETLINSFGISYPFENIQSYVASPDLTVGNFEGIVSPKHEHTPNKTFQFSIQNEYLTYLKKFGFDVLSIANNHGNDYGPEAVTYTRSLCSAIDIVCGGTPTTIDEYSTKVLSIGKYKYGFIFIQSVFSLPNQKLLAEAISKLKNESDIQIAYIHWGTEYELTHSSVQELLGHALIDMGVDAVIGHHPHVVEDMELYNGKPIFYSLGNFIFDQYFSPDVQEELTVTMTVQDNGSAQFELVPVTTAYSHAQPNFMTGDARNVLLQRVLKNVQNDPQVSVASSTVTVTSLTQ